MAAFLLGLLVQAGAGQIIRGRYGRGLIWFGLHLGAFLLLALGIVRSSPTLVGTGFIASVLLRVAAAVDAASMAPAPSLPSRPKALLFVVLLVIGGAQFGSLVVKRNMVEGFKMPSGSMEPTLLVGDHFFITKMFNEVKRGDIVVYKVPVLGRDMVKRVIGIAGDTVEARNGVLKLNGKELPRRRLDEACTYEDLDDPHDAYALWEETLEASRYRTLFKDKSAAAHGTSPPTSAEEIPSTPPTLVPPGSVFVVGDNRDHSLDSRTMGAVKTTDIKGVAVIIHWSSFASTIRWRRIGTFLR